MNNSNPIWQQIQDGGLDILNALLQYGYGVSRVSIERACNEYLKNESDVTLHPI
jgi:hypothetical protein